MTNSQSYFPSAILVFHSVEFTPLMFENIWEKGNWLFVNWQMFQWDSVFVGMCNVVCTDMDQSLLSL